MAKRPVPLILALAALGVPACRAANAPAPPARTVTVFNAGSLGAPLAAVARAFEAAHPGVTVHQETTGSLEAARKLTELGKIPDVLGVADVHVLTTLIEPAHAEWHATFATNAMVLLRSAGAAPLDSSNWVAGLLRPGIRTARADPELDPNGYRTLMAVQLASRAAGDPGLESKLLAAMPPAFMRAKEAELTALVQAGEVDYAWSYRSIALKTGLPYVPLGARADLSDPVLESWYEQASVRVPGGTMEGQDSVTLRGSTIAYGITVPKAAANPEGGEAFVAFLLSEAGRRILAAEGLTPLQPARFGGPGPVPATISAAAVAPAGASR